MTIQRQAHRTAFTLVELLVVVGIIAVLLGILIPVVARTKESGNEIKCRSNLSQIGKALMLYANDNKDHFPTPEAIGDGNTIERAAAFRRGINEPDPTDPTVLETLGLHNMLYRLGYAKAKEIWFCPSSVPRLEISTAGNSYMWNVTRTIAKYTSVQRGRVPRNATTGAPEPHNWWYVQDNPNVPPYTTNQPLTSNVGSALLGQMFLPHQYRAKRKVTSTVSQRQGSTNVLFYDGSVGMFVYDSRSASMSVAIPTVVRGEP